MQVLSFISALEPLSTVPQGQLAWFVEKSTIRIFNPGESVFSPGEPANHLYIVLEGSFKVSFERNGQRREIGDITAGEITGLLPYSRMTNATGNAVAKTKAKVLCFNREHFREMIVDKFELTQAFVHVMTNRIRTFTTLQIQNEKLMSLGKLSAGLAHELNNPASAIVRSANALRNHLKSQPDKFKKIMGINMQHEQIDLVNNILFDKISTFKANQLSLMERTEREDELSDWLEDHAFENAFELVENLVEFGFTEADLEIIKKHTGDKDLKPVVGWIVSNLSTEKMVEEIQEASVRIADLIKSIKGYTHMDRSRDIQKVDIHEGLRSTVTMLKHKIKKGQIILIEDFEPNLPEIQGFPGELNQVWTNIIDNALDALNENKNEPNPTLTFSTKKDGDFVKVFITDNGPGIPKEMINQIFDPFFTTKELGKGTGLGLDVATKIIRQHKGEIKVRSNPGMTEFEICLPIV